MKSQTKKEENTVKRGCVVKQLGRRLFEDCLVLSPRVRSNMTDDNKSAVDAYLYVFVCSVSVAQDEKKRH